MRPATPEWARARCEKHVGEPYPPRCDDCDREQATDYFDRLRQASAVGPRAVTVDSRTLRYPIVTSSDRENEGDEFDGY